MSSTINVQEPSAKPRRRIHKRTILVLTLFVVLPWVLISGPGQSIGGAGTTGFSVTFREYGWPFIHGDSVRYDLNPPVCNTPPVVDDPLPKEFDAKAKALEHFESFFGDEPLLRYDLRLEPEYWFSNKYWSEPANWPLVREDSYYRVRWLGLLFNLLTVVCVLFCVGIPFNRWVQGGCALTIRLILFAIIPIAIVMAYSVEAVREHNRDANFEVAIRHLHEKRLVYFSANHEGRLPRFVSQLFDHGATDGAQPTIFRRCTDAHASILVDQCGEPEIAILVNQLQDLPDKFLLRVDCEEFDQQTGKKLSMLSELRIDELMITFELGLFDEDPLSLANPLEHPDLKLDFASKLQKLNRLELWLTDDISQRHQLSPFVGIETLQTVLLYGVEEEGAAFLLETQDQWPDAVEIQGDELPEDMMRKLNERFSQD